MEVVFLGYADYNFTSKDGSLIDGIKFFYYFPSRKSNYKGFQSAGIFVQRSQSALIQQIQNAVPGQSYVLDMVYDGTKAVFGGLTAKKTA